MKLENQFEFVPFDDDLSQSVRSTALFLILNCVLYAGYILQLFLGNESLDIRNKNFVLVIRENIYGPILEEIIYRMILFNTLREGGHGDVVSALICNGLFGICKDVIKESTF